MTDIANSLQYIANLYLGAKIGQGWHQGGGKGGICPYHFQKKKKKRERSEKGKKQEQRRGKNKIKKIITNNLNAVYKWIKTDEVLRGVTPTSKFFKVLTLTNTTIGVNAPTCRLYENTLSPPLK